jgi:acetoin utilization protein AcuC
MPIAILYSDMVKEYDFGQGHPFRSDRFDVFMPFLKQRLSPGNHYELMEAEPATEDDLRLICNQDYIEFTKLFYAAANSGSYSPRLANSFHTFQSVDNVPAHGPGRVEEAARVVAGQAIAACDLVRSGRFEKAVSIGGGLHHAKPSYGEGFCIYNDVALSGLYLAERHGFERVLVLDTDAHAGNGTCEYFYGSNKVLFIDIHQDPRTVYPGTGFVHQMGAGDGLGFTINLPMPAGSGDDAYRLAFESVIEPVVSEFRPQIIIRNGGSDPHFADRLTNLGVTVPGFGMIGEKVRQMASACGGKVVDLLTSGYNLDVLPYAWLSLVCGLAGFDVPVEEPFAKQARYTEASTVGATDRMIDQLRINLAPYWSCMR